LKRLNILNGFTIEGSENILDWIMAKTEDESRPVESFDIEGFEALKMWAPVAAPSERFNGRFVPTGRLSEGRPLFVQDGNKVFMGRQRYIAWFNGYWRYYSMYDDTSKTEFFEECTFMVKSDAQHPADIAEDQEWLVHKSAMQYVRGPGVKSASHPFHVRIVRIVKASPQEPKKLFQPKAPDSEKKPCKLKLLREYLSKKKLMYQKEVENAKDVEPIQTFKDEAKDEPDPKVRALEKVQQP